MKIKSSLQFLACASALILTTPFTHAALLVYEGFDYPTSSPSLSGLNGGTGWSGAWTTVGSGSVSTVPSGSLTYSDLQTSGNQAFVTTTTGTSGVSRSFSSTYSDATTNTVYLSFTFQWDEGQRFFGLNLNNGATPAVEFNKLGGQSSFGIQGGSGTSSIVTDTTYFAVVRIDFNASGNDLVRLYLNPSSLDTEPLTANSTRSFASLSFDSVRLVAGYDNGTHSTAAAAFDEIRLGTSWSDVTPVPEPGSIAMLLLAIAGGIVMISRKRHAMS